MRRRRFSDHVNVERWLISYADFITLLFAFFVVMFALSEENKSKFEKMALGVRTAFGGAPAAGMIEVGGGAGGHTMNLFQVTEPSAGRVLNMPAGRVDTAADPDATLQGLKDLLEESISFEMGSTEISEHLQMQFDSRGLVIRIAVKDFFDPGAIEPARELRPVLDRIARILSQTDHHIRFEGYTDRDEKIPPGFTSDWEFSAARAAWMAQYWMKKFNLNPAQVGVAGYAHFRPLAEGRDELSRSKNRRVEIIVLNTSYSDSSHHSKTDPKRSSEEKRGAPEVSSHEMRP